MFIIENFENPDKQENQNQKKQQEEQQKRKKRRKRRKGELCPEITIVSILVYIFIYQKYHYILISKNDTIYVFSNFHTEMEHISYHGMIFCNTFWMWNIILFHGHIIIY